MCTSVSNTPTHTHFQMILLPVIYIVKTLEHLKQRFLGHDRIYDRIISGGVSAEIVWLGVSREMLWWRPFCTDASVMFWNHPWRQIQNYNVPGFSGFIVAKIMDIITHVCHQGQTTINHKELYICNNISVVILLQQTHIITLLLGQENPIQQNIAVTEKNNISMSWLLIYAAISDSLWMEGQWNSIMITNSSI